MHEKNDLLVKMATLFGRGVLRKSCFLVFVVTSNPLTINLASEELQLEVYYYYYYYYGFFGSHLVHHIHHYQQYLVLGWNSWLIGVFLHYTLNWSLDWYILSFLITFKYLKWRFHIFETNKVWVLEGFLFCFALFLVNTIHVNIPCKNLPT